MKKLYTPRETKLISTLAEMNLLNTMQFSDPDKSKEPEPVVAAAEKRDKPLRRKRPQRDEEKPVEPQPGITATDKQLPHDPVDAAADLALRETEVIQKVFFKSDSLLIKLYDHGVVDGDTVSVVLNGKVIVSRQRLTGKPTVSVIHVTPDLGDSLMLVMYAESLGTIPPNTGLLVILDGDQRYEIRFEGTKQEKLCHTAYTKAKVMCKISWHEYAIRSTN